MSVRGDSRLPKQTRHKHLEVPFRRGGTLVARIRKEHAKLLLSFIALVLAGFLFTCLVRG